MSTLIAASVRSSSCRGYVALARKAQSNQQRHSRNFFQYQNIDFSDRKAPNRHKSNIDTLSFRLMSRIRSSANNENYMKCWNCGEDFSHCVHTFITCSTCSAIRQPPPLEKIDFFNLFDQPKTYNIDPKILTQKFKALQRLFHPDVFVKKSEKEKELSENWSSIINEGYTILFRRILRANYLLQVYGQPLHEGEMMISPDFLSVVMDLNEEIFDAETKTDVIELMRKVNEELDKYDSMISKVFADNDIEKARLLVAEMQYFVNLRDKLVTKETEFGILD